MLPPNSLSQLLISTPTSRSPLAQPSTTDSRLAEGGSGRARDRPNISFSRKKITCTEMTMTTAYLGENCYFPEDSAGIISAWWILPQTHFCSDDIIWKGYISQRVSTGPQGLNWIFEPFVDSSPEPKSPATDLHLWRLYSLYAVCLCRPTTIITFALYVHCIQETMSIFTSICFIFHVSVTKLSPLGTHCPWPAFVSEISPSGGVKTFGTGKQPNSRVHDVASHHCSNGVRK